MERHDGLSAARGAAASPSRRPVRVGLLACAALAALLLSGCGPLKRKAAEYYLGRARVTAEIRNPSGRQLRKAFDDVGRALDYEPGSALAVDLLVRLSDSSSRAGFAGAQDLEPAALKKALRGAPLNWHARAALIDFFASRGDTGGVEAMASQAEAYASSSSPDVRYCALLAVLDARASALPWVENEGFLSLNVSPDTLFEKAAAYQSLADGIVKPKAEADRMAASDPSVRKAAPDELASAAEVAVSDALKDPAEAVAVSSFNARAASDPSFRKAVAMTVQGNAALVKKDYSQARAFYQAALNYFPGLVDARRQLAETDFQEGAALAAAGQDKKAASRLLYKAYAGSDAVIREAGETGSLIPFTSRSKFLGQAYALKAADLAALRAVEGRRLRNTERLRAEFKEALEEAVKLDPEGSLARDLLERYTKDGF